MEADLPTHIHQKKKKNIDKVSAVGTVGTADTVGSATTASGAFPSKNLCYRYDGSKLY